MTTPLLLGVDVGTGSARAGLFTTDGEQVGQGVEQISTWQTIPDHVEQSSDDIWRAVAAAVRAAVSAAQVRPEAIAGIGFDATCSLVALDGDGAAVAVSVDGGDERNVVVWMDHRAVDDAHAINATQHRVLNYVGGSISPEMQTPKLRWLKRELPGTWQRVQHWFDLPDFLTWRATGVSDRSLCSTVCKWTYLGHERRWDESYFSAIGLQDLCDDGFARIGRTVRVPGEALGGLSDVAADELGLGAGTPVSASLIDAHAGALGTLAVGSIDAPLVRRLAVIAGTSACHLAISREQVAVPGVWGPYYEALIPDHWLLEAGISASGAFLDHVLQSHPAAAGEENLFDLLEARVSALTANGGSIEQLTDDLHFQCNVLGNRAPLADPTLAGGLSGWRLRSDLNELARWYVAALQSLAYATRHIVDEFVAQGAPLQVLVASGGSANNARWRQTHADALGLPVAVPRGVDGVLLGSAMLGAAAAGVHPSLEAAMHAMAPDGDVVMPDAATRSFHDRKYRVYREMIQDQLGYAAIMRGDLK